MTSEEKFFSSVNIDWLHKWSPETGESRIKLNHEVDVELSTFPKDSECAWFSGYSGQFYPKEAYSVIALYAAEYLECVWTPNWDMLDEISKESVWNIIWRHMICVNKHGPIKID